MANNTSELKVTDLDFDLIKANLVEYFSSNPTFQDYDFEGSATNILSDILSYNTHMNAVMANLTANEMFIDSAQLRASVVSIAKALGYTPRSKRTSIAEITLNFTGITGLPPYLTMPSGTRFITPDNIIYSTKEQHLIYHKDGAPATEYEIQNVEIFEGYLNRFTYVVDDTTEQNFIIPSTNADISTLSVINTVGGESVPFYQNRNITLAKPDSKVFFIHENPDNTYEVTFGDNILGMKPINASEINLSYIISKYGAGANNSDVFQKSQLIDGWNSYTVKTDLKAYGSADQESKESVQRTAPQMYKAQSRVVITADYENFMLSEYPWIESLSVWGGEYNVPPVYGKVFMAIKPKNANIVANSLKDKIKNELIKNYNVVTIIPEIIDPDYLYILTDMTISYDTTQTTKTQAEITNLVAESIANYFITTVQRFNASFYFSKFSAIIDNTDQSITNSLTKLKMMKTFNPLIGASESREINFSNPIVPGSLYSTYYNISGTIGVSEKQAMYDDGKGILFTKSALTNEVLKSNIGVIDYATGIIDFSLTVYEVPPDTLDIRVYCTPVSDNIIPGYNQILNSDNSPANNEYKRTQGVSIKVQIENKDYK